jgi:hypothetical protein
MFVRNCPDCGKELSYSRKGNLDAAIKSNNVCTSCSLKGKTKSEEHCRNISEALKGKTLSQEHCRNLSESKKGEKNPNYGKSHSEEHRRKISIMRGGNGELDQKWPGMTTWAKRVKERDEYVCQHCYYDGLPHEMEAHHIVPKAKFPQYAYDLDNGQTLCKECHRSVHAGPTI